MTTAIEDNEERRPPTLSVNVRKGDMRENGYREVLLFIGDTHLTRKYSGSLVIKEELVPLLIEKLTN